MRIAGPSYKRPYNIDYGGEGISLTFHVDRNMDVKGYFDLWMANIIDPYEFNTVPGQGQTIDLTQSRAQYNSIWNTLLKYVGFSTIPGANYTNTGSTITDFFIDMNVKFSEDNIKTLYPLIRIFATQKHIRLELENQWRHEKNLKKKTS